MMETLVAALCLPPPAFALWMSGVLVVGVVAYARGERRGLTRGRRIECRWQETRSMLEAAVRGVADRRRHG
jgi:hypothetical protein